MLRLIVYRGLLFRTLSKSQQERAVYCPQEGASPSHVSLRNWTLKLGYYVLTHRELKGKDWIILLDHSIQFGQQKIFAVFGIRDKDFKKLKRPLQMQDLQVLLLQGKSKWNGEIVGRELEKLKASLGGISYAVGDYGSDLRKGLRISGIAHVHDLSHLVSLVTEKIYKESAAYAEFKQQMGRMRNKFIQTDIAAVVPPKQRKKSEYQSFDTSVRWAKKALKLIGQKWDNRKFKNKLKSEFSGQTLRKIKKSLGWLKGHQALIDELAQVADISRKIEKRFKHKGFGRRSFAYAEKILKPSGSETLRAFQSTLLEKLREQYQLMQGTPKFLCSSDILESTFGAYKNRQSENPMASVTNLMLVMAAFTARIDEDLVKKAMEEVTIKDIRNWSETEIGSSLAKQRRILLSDT